MLHQMMMTPSMMKITNQKDFSEMEENISHYGDLNAVSVSFIKAASLVSLPRC